MFRLHVDSLSIMASRANEAIFEQYETIHSHLRILYPGPSARPGPDCLFRCARVLQSISIRVIGPCAQLAGVD